MSDSEPCDLFHEAEDLSALQPAGPSHHFTNIERPSDLGSIKLRMVTRHALWGDHLWNAGQWLATHFDLHPELVHGKSVVELGAGAGLPSVISALCGARLTVVTDYPDPELVENLQWNLDINVEGDAHKRSHSRGFLWGASVHELLTLNGCQKYDVLILCDLLFNHSEHQKLIKSCQELLAIDGLIWCVYTHYLPDRIQKDLRFLELSAEAGFQVEHVGKHRFEHLIFENDKGDPEVRRTCNIVHLKFI